MHTRFLTSFITVCTLLLIANCNEEQTATGEQLAGRYCGSCHLVPDPLELDKKTWQQQVLPKMAEKLGLAYYNGEYFTNVAADTIKGAAAPITIDFASWQKIVQYYSTAAPATQPLQNRPPVNRFTKQFTVKEGIMQGIYPSAVWVKIDPGNNRLYTANAYDSLFTVFDTSLTILAQNNIHRVAVDLSFENDLTLPGERQGVLTHIGILYPNDVKTGSLEGFRLTGNGTLQLTDTIAKELPRPVQGTGADMNKDGLTDYLVCGFGNEQGALLYFSQNATHAFKQQPVKSLPGAIKAYVDDYDKDGLPDIIALFAQAQEGIYLFRNKGNGSFETRTLLNFPAIYGSSYFELQDVNGDGLTDIIYTCGDNLDYTAHVLKSFHGVYIFLNKGNDRFEQRCFFPIHGCYKAMVKDFDMDGDMDIAAIAYFPDRKHQPEESFVFLENKGDFNYTPYTIKEFNSGNWMVMDAADIDGDGDDDIVLGSMLLTITTTPIAIAPGKKEKPSVLLLVNQTK